MPEEDAMADTGSERHLRNRYGWRRLGAFWVAVLGSMAVGALVLQILGPPDKPGPAPPQLAGTPPGDAHVQASSTGDKAPLHGNLVAPVLAGRDTPGPVADPDPALLEPLSPGSAQNLPRIASDGRTAMRVYAAGFDHSSRRPRVGLVLAGIGMNEAESDAAIRTLPGAVSLAVSPYAAADRPGLPKLLARARTNGHEYLVSLPLEPAGFPLNDPGPQTLLTSGSVSTNSQNLRWVLSRIDGYVGVIGVTGTMRGERMAAMTDQMDAVLSELAGRGLLYVDPRQGSGPIPKAWGRHVDLVIDDPADDGVADRAMIDSKLAALEQQARDAGSALGLVMRPTPAAVARIAAWSNGLVDRGLALAPVSALVMPATDAPVKLSERQD
jgi:polysaccharide deacetylase 2 family uncharacterized protein YibQ